MANYHVILKNQLQDYLSSATYDYPTRDYNITFTLMEADGRKKTADGNIAAGLAYAQGACLLKGKWFDENFASAFIEDHGLQDELVRSLLTFYKVPRVTCWEAAARALRWFIKEPSHLPNDRQYEFRHLGNCLVDQYDTLHLCRSEDEHLVLPEGIRSINHTAFEKETIENLRSITLPSTIGLIHFGSFDRCQNLENIYIPSGHSNYCSIDGVLFDPSEEKLMLFPTGRGGEYEIPPQVTALSYYSFHKAPVSHVILPEGLKIIEEGAFSGCRDLTHMRIPASVEAIEAFAFENCENLITVAFLGKDTELVDCDHFEDANNVVFYCDEASCAAEYAFRHGIPCFPLGKEPGV